MALQHNHSAVNPGTLKMAIVLNMVITIAQIIGGIWVGSLALITDATHNFTDVAALLISLVALKLGHKAFTKQKSFGYKRAETMAAFINALTIILVAILIFIESVKKLVSLDLTPINGNVVMILAAVAIVINGFSAWLLYSGAQHNLNFKSAFLHLVSDTLFSLAVLIGGWFMQYQHIYWIDSVLSIAIALFLVYSSWPILSKTMQIFMQFSPTNIDLDLVKKEVEALPMVINMHHVHIWELDENTIHFEAHIELHAELSLVQVCKQLQAIDQLLKNKFNIAHTTLQPENGVCQNPQLLGNPKL